MKKNKNQYIIYRNALFINALSFDKMHFFLKFRSEIALKNACFYDMNI